MKIHPTAIISKKAKLGENVEIGPYAVIEDDVQIGQRVKIYAQAQILKGTVIGDDCQIHMGAILGHLPQIRNLDESKAGSLTIGRRNIFREYSSIHSSSSREKATIIGNDNYFMGFSHVAHDCVIGNHVTVCNGTLIAGHVNIEDYAFISGNVTVHQFVRIGTLSMVGGLARVAQDIPPYMLVKGDSSVWAINSVGLRRAKLPPSTRNQIKEAFKVLYKSNLNVKQAIGRLENNNTPEIRHLVNFIRNSRRGICSYKDSGFWKNILSFFLNSRCKTLPAYRVFSKNRKGQEPLALALLIVFLALIFIFLNRPLKEAVQSKYHQLIQAVRNSFSY